jgi:hypothetical protein
MGAYKTDVSNLPVVMHCHHQSVVVSLDIENNAISA